jgi:hypothetical protein
MISKFVATSKALCLPVIAMTSKNYRLLNTISPCNNQQYKKCHYVFLLETAVFKVQVESGRMELHSASLSSLSCLLMWLTLFELQLVLQF